MYNIYFYQDKNGHQLVLEYIQNLKKRETIKIVALNLIKSTTILQF